MVTCLSMHVQKQDIGGHCVRILFLFPLYSPETESLTAELAGQQTPSVLCICSNQFWDWMHAHTRCRYCSSHHLSHLPSPHCGSDLSFPNGLPVFFWSFFFFFHLFIGHQRVFSEKCLFKSFAHFPNWVVLFWRKLCCCQNSLHVLAVIPISKS